MTTRANRSRGMPRRSAPLPERSSRMPLIIGGSIAALVAVTAVIAILLSSAQAGPTIAQPARAPVAVSGEALIPLADPVSDSAIGQLIPSLSGTGLQGEPVIIAPGEGPMVIVALAHWCGFCQAEVPVLVDYLAANGMPEGVRLVGLATGIDPARPNFPPKTWLEREEWTAPTLIDDASSSAMQALGVTEFPGFIFVDTQGRVVQRVAGQIGADTFAALANSLATSSASR